ncbi:MAG TPA: hypothetical protein VFH17_01550, partial [Coriobacteriia bacterium]|nr:hypothetical protein [Coriobacteriia bacterium]
LFGAGEPVAPRSARIDPEFAARVEQEIADRLRVAARESAEEAGAVPVAERVEVEPVAAPERADAFLDQPTAIFLNERGEVVATTIREAIERADADVAQARLDARAFDVAVACALRSSVSR